MTASLVALDARASVNAQASPRTASARIGLVLADGHPIVLHGLQSLLQGQPDLDVLACCTTGAEALAAVDRHHPAILVLDLHLPGRGGLALLDDLAATGTRTRVVVLTGSVTTDEMSEALRLGVKGVALKEMAPELLLACIRQVHQGSLWLENASASEGVERIYQRELSLRELRATLTRRELQILPLVASGMRNKDITSRLDITEGTVKIHLHNIYRKLGLKDRLELVLATRDKALF